ncbi:MAG: hypothetical protein Q9157_008166 [Trypethelium eluteriae]
MDVSTLSPVQTLHFFDLPRELRDEVYEYVAAQEDIEDRADMVCQFAGTCPQVKTELFRVVLRLNAMVFKFPWRRAVSKKRSQYLPYHYVQFLALLDPEEEDAFLSRPVKICTTIPGFIKDSLPTQIVKLHENCRVAPRFMIECGTVSSAAETSGLGHLHVVMKRRSGDIVQLDPEKAREITLLCMYLTYRAGRLRTTGWTAVWDIDHANGALVVTVLMERAIHNRKLGLADLARYRLRA